MGSGSRRPLRGYLIKAGKFLFPFFRTRFLWSFRRADWFWNSMISYPNYKFIFPIKALGMFAKRYGDVELL